MWVIAYLIMGIVVGTIAVRVMWLRDGRDIDTDFSVLVFLLFVIGWPVFAPLSLLSCVIVKYIEFLKASHEESKK